ncbi:MAG: DUF6036 family nucleotidyltransferase [Flavobacteriales bacterium]
MHEQWENKIDSFIELADKFNLEIIMVGGGAVNFYGYQRHSADVDFWINTTPENFTKLKKVLTELGFEVEEFPDTVKNKEQNISIKFSPNDLDLELITKFSSFITFDEAYKESEIIEVIKAEKKLKWNVLSYKHLIESKIRANRPKDLLDIQELKRIKDGEI